MHDTLAEVVREKAGKKKRTTVIIDRIKATKFTRKEDTGFESAKKIKVKNGQAAFFAYQL